MEYQNINNSLNSAERVTSTYAEIYFNDNSFEKSDKEDLHIEKKIQNVKQNEEWISPSDQLIGVLKLHPPFTSKITRGKTHEGILDIGNEVLDKERAKFSKSLAELLHDNDASWNLILAYEKQEIIKKIKNIYQNIFKYKSNIMKQEISLFYENSLKDLERHLYSEIQNTLQIAYANIISNLNEQIQGKLQKERKKLENILKKKFILEILKVKKYYSLLLHNELHRNNKLVNKALHERNDAIKLFYKQIEAERITSTMYVMSLERRKCKIKKMVLENLQTSEILDKSKKIKDNSNLIEAFEQKYVGISDVNKQWEEKIKKVLQLFLKFISFSLKLLPEQTTFLLDLEKMIVLQLNEIRKNPEMHNTVLLNEETETNIFKFEEPKQELHICEKDPFVLIGDLSEPIPEQYGSRETLPSDVDLPYFRVGRQYIYAKCHGYESIKKFLDSQKCKCHVPRELSPQRTSNIEMSPKTPISPVQYESSLESLLVDNIERFQECPARKCCNWIQEYSFPNLAFYLDYSEENYKRVTAILNSVSDKETSPKLINAKNIAYSELPFSATKEPYHTIGTQYSSQEDMSVTQVTCSCIENIIKEEKEINTKLNSTCDHDINTILAKRKKSLDRLINKNPNLLKIFTDECFDYKL